MPNGSAEAVTADRFIAAVDSRGGHVVVDGWRTMLDLTPTEAVRALEPYAGEFLYTHVDREGLMQGTDMGAIEAVRNATTRRLTAAGGITTMDEVEILDAMGVDAVVGHGDLHRPDEPAGQPGRERPAKVRVLCGQMPVRIIRHSLLLVFLSTLGLLSAGCSRPPGLFSEPNARAHIGMLAGTIGSRPIGTPANAKARAYIIDQLRLFGFDVRVQEADARRAAVGLTARVSNIIAVRPGRRSEAIALVSHYDSVPAGPGAADDALGVGVSLEAARVLAARADRNWTLMILVTDGEEAGLMGAAALITDREVTSRLQAYVNLEAIGSAGPPMLFETGPGNGWIVRPWARHAPEPARRIVRDRDLPSPAERHGFLDPEAPGHSRIELRGGRRQLRVSHGARHARTAVAADRPAHRRTGRRGHDGARRRST